ncbi:helix-turn-helix transcriptional regulator [Flavobacterium sp. GP15]|uniref:helix-turn-helix transcriptional regulator n=1 Tax=Flavobacterium sp. GP15 TaxID=2758567 RepID=UPI00165E4CD1|nr:helix-turn-helix transcriptional regulator [Flavobacterium sp. GP15]
MAELTKEDIVLQKKISERMEFLRNKTGLSQSDFAKEHDIDRQVINRWESTKNKRGVTIYSINKFCDMINITIKDFFDDDTFSVK